MTSTYRPDAWASGEAAGGATPALPAASTALAAYLTGFWMPRKHHSWARGTQRYREWAVDTLLRSPLAHRPIGDLRVFEIERWFAERAMTPFESTGKIPAPSSMRALLDTLKASLNDAVRYGILTTNPCIGVELPRSMEVRRAMWTAEQVQLFLASTEDSRYSTLWRVLLATGLRRGEALGLQWVDVDLDRRILEVRRAVLADSRKDNSVYGPPKTRRSLRTISLDSGTVDALQRWRRRRETEHAAFVAALERQLVAFRTPGARLPELPQELPAESPVFAAEDGQPMLPATVSDTWRRQVRASGLPPCRLHDTRHIHLTHLLRAGEPIQNVSARAGHGSPFTTLNTYAHVMSADDERTAARAGGLFGD